MSPLEFVTRHFTHDAIRAGLLFFNGLREVDLRLPGFGHAIPSLLASPSKAEMCVGGSGNLARGLVQDITSHGGEIRCGVELRQIILRQALHHRGPDRLVRTVLEPVASHALGAGHRNLANRRTAHRELPFRYMPGL